MTDPEASTSDPRSSEGTRRARVAEGSSGEPTVLLVLASSGWGGTEKAFVELAHGLVGTRTVMVAVPHDASYLDRLPDGLDSLRTLQPGSRRNPLALLHLRRIVRELDPDVIHSHAARAAEMVHWATLGLPVRHVATKHNTRDRWIFPRVRCVTAVSEQVRASIRGRSDVDVVYDAVEIGPVPEVGLPDRFTLLGVGRLHPHKGFDLLIRALAESGLDADLWIAGEGPEREALSRLAQRLGVGDRVTLLGQRQDVPELMAGAHAVVVPSRNEGFSLALVEAVLAGRVVLSTGVGVAPEILPERLLTTPDTLAHDLRLLPDHYDELVAATSRVRERVTDRFSTSAMVEGYASAYRKAMQRGR